MLNIVKKEIDGVIIFGFDGRLDAMSASDVEDYIKNEIDSGCKSLLMDFTYINYISSAGIRVLLYASKLLNSVNGKFSIFGVKDIVKEVLEIAGFDTVIDIFSSEEDALNKVK